MPARPVLSQLFSAVRAPEIALAALVRLRWLAVAGQITATLAAWQILRLNLPLAAIAGIIGITGLSNILLAGWMKLGRGTGGAGWFVPSTLLLDILLLTALLYLTGGSDNPFAALYLVNLAISVIVLGPGWTWMLVGVVAACYGLVVVWHRPLAGMPASPPPWSMEAGRWLGLVLVCVLIAVFVGRVVRALRLREGELAEARQRAARNEHLAALTTLAAGAAHELNTPLGTIAVVARELENGCGAGTENDPVREDAQLIRHEVDRCRRILNRMRVELVEEATPAPLEADDLVERLRQSLSADENARLTVRCLGVRQFVGPPRTLEQTLLVLLRNAFDASAARQAVELCLSAAPAGGVRFTVRDQGCGMTPEQLRRVGQPFFTTKEPGKGMGLGLFLVRLVAERLGADFALESEPNVGTCVTIDLPGAQHADTGQRTRPSPPSQTPEVSGRG